MGIGIPIKLLTTAPCLYLAHSKSDLIYPAEVILKINVIKVKANLFLSQRYSKLKPATNLITQVTDQRIF
jgi:hypothetical protein